MPAVSVIIPNFNRAQLIGETIECMLRQSLPPHEIIVVDDGSTDKSLEVIRSFGDRVRVLCQTNSGPAVARNRGLDHATGDFIQFFDSDDLCSLNKIETQVIALIRSGADFAYGPWLKTYFHGKHARYAEPVLQQGALPGRPSPLSCFLRGWVIVFQCCLFKRSFLSRVGRYRPDLMPSEDSEFMFRMLKSGARAVHVCEALVLYRVHEEGQISGGALGRARRVRDWAHYSETVLRQLDGVGEPISRFDTIRWRATVCAAQKAVASLPEPSNQWNSQDIQFGPLETLFSRVLVRVREVTAGMRQRVSGHRWPFFYRPGALTEAQKRLIQELGYIPLQSIV
jgi:glycosyltransferase involved in cell wall biosynthesis